MALYDELQPIQTQLEANGMRLRYGVVPYSTTVNVGALIRAVNPAYLVDSMPYQFARRRHDPPDRRILVNAAAAGNPGHADLWQCHLANQLRQIWPQRELQRLLAQRDYGWRSAASLDLVTQFFE